MSRTLNINRVTERRRKLRLWRQ